VCGVGGCRWRGWWGCRHEVYIVDVFGDEDEGQKG